MTVSKETLRDVSCVIISAVNDSLPGRMMLSAHTRCLDLFDDKTETINHVIEEVVNSGEG